MKELFIKAYQWAYGTTRKEAEYIYSISTNDYIILIIHSFDQNAKVSFQND